MDAAARSGLAKPATRTRIAGGFAGSIEEPVDRFPDDGVDIVAPPPRLLEPGLEGRDRPGIGQEAREHGPVDRVRPAEVMSTEEGEPSAPQPLDAAQDGEVRCPLLEPRGTDLEPPALEEVPQDPEMRGPVGDLGRPCRQRLHIEPPDEDATAPDRAELRRGQVDSEEPDPTDREVRLGRAGEPDAEHVAERGRGPLVEESHGHGSPLSQRSNARSASISSSRSPKSAATTSSSSAAASSSNRPSR